MSTYYQHDLAYEIMARMDGHREPEGVEFHADTITHSVVVDKGAFLVTAVTPDGESHDFRVEVHALNPGQLS